MLDAPTNTLMDTLVRPLLSSESRGLASKLTRVAERAYQGGLSGSGVACSRRTIAYRDHYKDLAGAVWAAMLRVLEETDVQPYPELSGDLKRKFDDYMGAPAERIRSDMVALSQMGHGMPRETFDGLREEIRAKYHTEIELQCAKASAKLKRAREARVRGAGKKRRTKPPRTVEKEIYQEAGSKCAFCPVTKVASLEVHHIDGNPTNNGRENLILVCANCHSEITRGVISEADVRLKKRQLVEASKR